MQKEKNKAIKVNNPRFKSIINYNKKHVEISFCMNFICVFAIILYNCYQDIMKFVLQMFSCIEIGDPSKTNISEKRLLIELSIDCESYSHKTILLSLVLPLILFIGLCFPAVLFFLMGKLYHKGELNKPVNLYKFGYFYYAYKRPYYYWDFLILLRKTSLLFIYCFFVTGKTMNDIYPIFIILIILIVNLIYHIETKPFDVINFNLLNILEKYSLGSLSMSIYLALFLFTYLANNNSYNNEVFYTVMAIMTISNGLFFVKWIKVSYKHLFKPEVQTYIHKTSTIINIIKNRLSKNPTNVSIPSNRSLETIENEPSNQKSIQKLKKASFEIIKERRKSTENTQTATPTNYTNPIFPLNENSETSRKLLNMYSGKVIFEEDEEESPVKIFPQKKKPSVLNARQSFEINLNEIDETDENAVSLPHLQPQSSENELIIASLNLDGEIKKKGK